MKKQISNSKKKGFTLVELIVVIAILAILAALAVPRVERFVEEARISQRESNFQSVYTAARVGYTEWLSEANNSLPVTAGTAPNPDTPATTNLATGGATGQPLETLLPLVQETMPGGHTIVATDTDDDTTWVIEYTSDADGGLGAIVVTNDGFTATNGGEVQ